MGCQSCLCTLHASSCPDSGRHRCCVLLISLADVAGTMLLLIPCINDVCRNYHDVYAIDIVVHSSLSGMPRFTVDGIGLKLQELQQS